MAKNFIRKVHRLDARGRVLGRLATEVSQLLRGKNKVDFEPQFDRGDIVELINVDKIVVTGKKAEQKVYRHHSGYPGGLKEIKFSKLMAEKPEEILRKAVWNMLPKNKLRSKFINRLRFIK